MTTTIVAPAVTSTVPVACGDTPNPYTTNGKTFSVTCQSVYFGNYLFDTVYGVLDLEKCIDICAANSECVAVDFYAPAGNCFLLSDISLGSEYDGGIFDSAALIN